MKIMIKYIFIIIAPYLFLNLLYRRLFREVSPININILNTYQITFYIYLSLLFIFLIIKTIINKFSLVENTNIFTKNYNIIINEYYRALINIEDYLQIKIKHLFNFEFNVFASRIIQFLKKPFVKSWYIYLCLITPKIIVVIIFIIDIFIFKTIKYFYFSLTLLLVPMFIEYCIYLLKKEYDKGFDKIKDLVDIIDKNSNTDITLSANNQLVIKTVPLNDYIMNHINYSTRNLGIVLSLHTFNQIKDISKIDVKATVNKYTNYIKFLISVKRVLANIQQLKARYDFCLNMFCYIIYFIGWSFIILNYFY